MTDTPQNETKFVFSDTVVFDMIVLIFFIILAVMSFEYNPRARSIPLGLGIIGAAMMLLQFIADAIPALRPRLRFVVQSGILGGADNEKLPHKNIANEEKPIPPHGVKDEKASDYWLQVLRVVLWLVGFIVLLIFVNYLIAVAAFIVLITKLEAKQSWTKSILLAFCVDASFFILFDLILQAHL